MPCSAARQQRSARQTGSGCAALWTRHCWSTIYEVVRAICAALRLSYPQLRSGVGYPYDSFGSKNDDEQWSPKYRLEPDLSGVADFNWRRFYGPHRPEELDAEFVDTDWSGATGPPYDHRHHVADTPGWREDWPYDPGDDPHEPDRGWELYEGQGIPVGMPT